METVTATTPLIEPVEVPAEIPRDVVVFDKRYPQGFSIRGHNHEFAQLEYASLGVLKVRSRRGVWCVPPQRAVVVPAHVEHETWSAGDIELRSLYIRPEAAPRLPADCCVVSVPPVLRELMLHAVTWPSLYERGSAEERVMEVIVDIVQGLEVAPLDLPTGSDARLGRIYDLLTEDPADNRSLESWGHEVGASARTLARLFQAQTGMSFSQWRQQFRIIEAIERLERGDPVTAVALGLGYESPSAFITMFRKALGKTPGQYLRG